MGTQKLKPKGTLIIAGPGAGKTHNMVESIIEKLPELSPCRYMAVITYTNSATNNIHNRLSKRISIPENLFIGTIHSFLNRFIVIPFSPFASITVGNEKLFIQCGIDDVVKKVESLKDKEQRSKTFKDKAILKSKVTQRLNAKGYITYDQTLSLAKDCMTNPNVSRIVSNRLQFLFIDEFQDSGNEVFAIIESLRKQNNTKIYCVGDPEQYIQSFDSSIKNFKNIPILKAAANSNYHVEINSSNYRSTSMIVDFLNNFNGRYFKSTKFQQQPCAREKESNSSIEEGLAVVFINKSINVKPIIERFFILCDMHSIVLRDRCIVAKKNDVINRIVAALDGKYMNPKKNSAVSPIKAIQDTLLSTLQMNQTEFLIHHKTNVYTLRKYAVMLFKNIQNGTITNENTFGAFVADVLKLKMKNGLPVKVENLRFDLQYNEAGNAVTVSNIHTIKGLENKAVLAIAKTEEELLLWLETDHTVRDTNRDTDDMTDSPRLGYVAFSRAEHLLCIACMEKVSDETISRIEKFGIIIQN